MESNWDVIVIGAGMAGLSAAQKLQAAGRRVLVLEKSRGVGGRMATRRDENAQWDHGAQYFTARSAIFRRQVAIWLRANQISRWTEPIYAWDGQNLQISSPQQRFVGTPKMNAPLRAMATALNLKLSVQVTAIQATTQGWQVSAGEQIWQAQQLVLAIPAPQAATLIPSAHPTQAVHAFAAHTPMQPCWAVMLSCEHAINLPFAGAFINDGALSWLAHDSSKLGRAGQNWVLHASVAWSQAHLENSADEVIALLIQEFNRLLKQWGQAEPNWQNALAHRWKFAQGSSTEAVVQSAETGLVLAGDWLAGGRIEGAYLSGIDAANALLAATVVQ
ncbi:FAD-dependent oxidoreductase [Chitinibacter bivalviorum]|uniref:FAD-dependent oxidoreductase n=1 Tax=Chitinibacter bivalviorum TaxID=2739434 RepID=A0A7H9BI74_9NEIS|nr:FAD-dependent oxidoreductase [Chitinibacter bivalviorum]QLG88042.1 FAD-dependent oxidoreductase [Chitinibacter bivalviorum]